MPEFSAMHARAHTDPKPRPLPTGVSWISGHRAQISRHPCIPLEAGQLAIRSSKELAIVVGEGVDHGKKRVTVAMIQLIE